MRRMLCAALLAALCVCPALAGEEADALYRAALEDAVWADAEEIEPLVCLRADDAMTTWDAAGERVLLLSWHAEPEAYPAGAADMLAQSDIWTFTDREIAAWYAENRETAEDWTVRLEQLIGLPLGSGYTHVTGFWADPADVVRPAYEPDPRAPMRNSFSGNEDAAFRDWFDANILYSYFESAYPWTRLGYTYDWAEGGREYGLSEFLIRAGSPVGVEFTMPTDEFLAWLGGAPSSAGRD